MIVASELNLQFLLRSPSQARMVPPTWRPQRQVPLFSDVVEVSSTPLTSTTSSSRTALLLIELRNRNTKISSLLNGEYMKNLQFRHLTPLSSKLWTDQRRTWMAMPMESSMKIYPIALLKQGILSANPPNGKGFSRIFSRLDLSFLFLYNVKKNIFYK